MWLRNDSVDGNKLANVFYLAIIHITFERNMFPFNVTFFFLDFGYYEQIKIIAVWHDKWKVLMNNKIDNTLEHQEGSFIGEHWAVIYKIFLIPLFDVCNSYLLIDINLHQIVFGFQPKINCMYRY